MILQYDYIYIRLIGIYHLLPLPLMPLLDTDSTLIQCPEVVVVSMLYYSLYFSPSSLFSISKLLAIDEQ